MREIKTNQKQKQGKEGKKKKENKNFFFFFSFFFSVSAVCGEEGRRGGGEGGRRKEDRDGRYVRCERWMKVRTIIDVGGDSPLSRLAQRPAPS